MTAASPAPTLPDDGAPQPPPWGLAEAGLAILAALVVSQVAASIVLAVAGVETDEVDDVSLVVRTFLQLGLWVGMIGAVAVVLRLRGGSWRNDLRLRVRTWDLPAGIVVGILCQLWLVPLVSTPWSWIVDRDLDTLKEPACRLAEKADDPVGVVVFFITTALLAPVVEEIFYRGFLQRPAVAVLGRALGVVGVALLFGGSHFQLLQLGALVAFGLLLGVVTERTGRLGPAIGIHVGFNATTVVTLVATSGSLERECGDVLSVVRGLL